MNGFAGTATLARLALRRDRFSLPAWVLALTALLSSFTAMSVSGLPTHQDVITETAMMAGTPAMRMMGLASGPSIGGYAMVRGYVTLAVLAALMSTLAVVRHTRQNEETGRAELVGAAVVGRFAGLAAAMLVAVGADVALVPLLAGAMIAAGQPVAGSVAAGAAVAAVGVAFAGVAAVAVQLSSSTRVAGGVAGATIGLAFLLSGVGNMVGDVDASGLRVVSAWPAWLSPIGWGQQMRPFGGDHWWPLVLFAGLVLVLLAVAGVLVTRRDLSQGILLDRQGRSEATGALLRPFGLVWRLQRGALLGWAVAMLAFGLLLGAISGEVTQLEGAAADWYTQRGGTDEIVDAYRAAILAMAAMAVAVHVVQVVLRMRAEEAEGRLEPVLSAAVSRPRWMAGYVVAAVGGSVGLLLVFAVSMGLAAGGGAAEQVAAIGDLTAAALVQVPGVLVIGAVVAAVVGLLPRWAAPLSWALLLTSIVLGPMFAADLGVPAWARDLSPFTHVPMAPAVQVAPGPLVALTAVTVALAAAGFVLMRRRDLAP